MDDRRKPGIRALAAAVGALLVVGGGAASAYVAASVLDVGTVSDGDEGASGQAPASPTAVKQGGTEGGRWGAVGRERLAACVAAVGPTGAMVDDSLQAERDMITSTLESLKSEPVWDQYNEGFPDPVVDVGCPTAPAVYDPDAGPYITQTFFHVRGRVVTEASYYYLHIYILPQDEIDKYDPPPIGARFTPEELFCGGGSCIPVTVGLHVSEGELGDPVFFTNILAQAIGVRGVR